MDLVIVAITFVAVGWVIGIWFGDTIQIPIPKQYVKCDRCGCLIEAGRRKVMLPKGVCKKRIVRLCADCEYALKDGDLWEKQEEHAK